MLRTSGLVIAVALLMGACGGGGGDTVEAMAAPLTFNMDSGPGKSASPMVPTRRASAAR